MNHPSRRRIVILALTILASVLVLGLAVRPAVGNALHSDPVQAAWARARDAGSYHFTSDVTQVTVPGATIANVGRTSRTERLYLEGQNDLHSNQMEMTLWSEGGSVLQAGSGVAVRVENGKTFARRGEGEWEEVDTFTDGIAPQGDFLAYLAALRQVKTHPPEERNGIRFTRYSFVIDGPAFAEYVHAQMEATLRTRGELPPTMRLEAPHYLRDLTGEGELWVGEDGLPLRQILNLQFPEQKDERVHAQMVVDFSGFGTPQPSVVELLAGGDIQRLLNAVPNTLPDLSGVLIILPLLGGVVLMVRYRRARVLYNSLAITMILSLVLGPLLNTFTNVRFIDTQSAKAAAQEERQATARQERDLRAALGAAPEFNPYANLLESTEVGAQNLHAPVSHPELAAAAPAALLTDDGTDSDGDTLSDFIEERIGTSPEKADSDNDGVPDNLEVNGFPFGSQTWYTNPASADSNTDGLADAIEWGLDANGAFRATPLDTDGDGHPDLFDADNDNDGVPDNKDLSPFTTGASTYNEAAPLQLTLSNLAPNQPTLVEFQLRPQNAQHLGYAFNVLDWPQDSLGQVQDVDGKTYADYAAGLGRTPDAIEAYGDMKVIPMLEIRVPDNGANLPSQDDLTPFNITVNNFTPDGQTKVVYVPLNVVTDERSGQRVAFSGQMRYQPGEAWPSAHQVRLVWVVQALVDAACDPEDAAQVAQGCQPDGYIYNRVQPIQSYYSDWTLTGLTVREDNGASMGIFYEDPAVDNNPKDDEALWALSFVLDHHFVVGRSDRLPLDEVANRFDRTRNTAYSEDQRFAVPNITRAVTQTYASLEQAVAFTAMTETVKILDDVFTAPVTDDRDIKPLLLFAQESKARMLTLDGASTGNDYVTQSGANLTFDMAPSGQPAQTVAVVAGLKWMGYCAPASGAVTFQPCAADEYWDELEQRYAALPNETGESDPELVGGRLQLAQLYYTSLATGYYGTVQDGSQLVSGLYSLDNEAETVTQVRFTLQGIATVPLLAAQAYARVVAPFQSQQRSKIPVELAQWGATLRKTVRNSEKMLANAATPQQKVLYSKSLSSLRRANFWWRVAPIATAGAALMVVTQIVSLVPTVPINARIVTGSIAATLSLTLGVVLPAIEVGIWISSGATTFKALANSFNVLKSVKIGGAIGLVIGIGITWGFFIYAAATSGLAAGSPQLNKLAVEAITSTVITIFLFVLAANPIGAIIVGVVAFVDFLLTLICELGVDELRVQGAFYGGACFTLNTTAVKVLSYFLYNYDLMVDMARNDLVVTGAPDVRLANPSKGYVAGNALSVSLPVTTTVVHKDPDPANGLYIYPYLWLFSPDNIRSNTFQYSLTQPDAAAISVARNQMNEVWQHVEEDHKLVLTPMYRGIAAGGPFTTTPLITPTVGLNQRVSFYFNMGYAVPAYECVGIPNPLPPFVPPVIPICYTRDSTGNNSTKIDELVFDIFPPTLDGFLTLAAKAGNGRGLAWDPAFGSLADADGDGLLAAVHNGLDPDDSTVDADADGLTDRFELELQANGLAYAPGLVDSDGDGLTDLQEATLGTDPGVADTDNDGLTDGEEVRHLVYDANGGAPSAPTTTWDGGWPVRINANPPFEVYVSSDPFVADSDGDGIGDLAERQLALSTCTAQEVDAGRCEGNPPKPVDNQNRPYHPLVPNTPPLAVYTASDDFDGFVRPGQSFRYTTTVVASSAVAPGVLNVDAPSVVGGSTGSPLGPYALAFDPLTFSGAQTVTQQTDFAVAGNAPTQGIVLTSTANTRLANSGAAGWAWEPVTEELLPAIASPNLVRDTALAVARADRQDRYIFAGQTVIPDGPSDGLGHQRGDILAYALPGGAARQLDVDTDALNTAFTPAEPDGAFLRGMTDPSVACNDAGTCMVVWQHLDYCNTLTINSITILNAGNDHGTSGMEPLLYLVRAPDDDEPRDGGFQLLWDAQNNGGNDMGTGATRGPHANGFPINLDFCGPTALHVSEVDGSASYSSDPAQTEWDGMVFLGSHQLSPTQDRLTGKDLDFSGGDGYSVRLNVSVGFPATGRQRTIAGALLAPDGTIGKPQFQVTDTSPNQDSSYNPAVASDGANFLAVWENLSFSFQGFDSEINTRLFDASGNPLNDVQSDIDPVRLNDITVLQSYADLTATWATDRYIVTRLMRPSGGVTFDPASAHLVTARHIAAGGSYLAGSTTTLVDDATDSFANHSLAWDPARGNALLVYRAINGSIKGKVYGNLAADPVQLAPVGARPQAAYHPLSQSWLVSYINTGRVQFRNFTGDLSGSLVSGTQPEFPSQLTTNNLACPASGSVPVVDLRFEELPGATSFADSSGRNHHAACSGASCPTAGVAGAPNAPLSDYALQFDGVDDFLTLNHALPDDFTVAFWLKAPPAAVPDMILLDQGANQAGGFTVWLSAGRPGLLINTTESIIGADRIDDDQWHFVAATRDRSSGAVALYVDGNPTPVAVNTFATGALNVVNDMRIGGDRNGNRDFTGSLDHAQIFPIALGGDAIQAIYNRTQQGFCVGGGAESTLNRIRWARLELTQQDTRGGALSASGALRMTIDNDAPTAGVTSVQNDEVVGPDQVIGGTASDPTSGVGLVEVSIDGGAWLAANGANTWSFSLAGHSGDVSIRARATDLAGNVGAASAAVNVTVDSTAPQVTINAPADTIKPTKNANDQWQVSLSGTATDNASGMNPGSVQVRLEQQSGVGAAQTTQTAALDGDNWRIDYTLAASLFDPTGSYTMTVQAEDNLGNRAAPATAIVRLDAAGPRAAISASDIARQVITQTITIGGVVSDTNSIAGIDTLEIAFTPLEQIAALPANVTSDEAEAQLNRTWHPVTLAQRGAGVATTTWSFEIPAGLENIYQIDLRGTDILGNASISSGVWRGMIDTQDPRVVMSATATGASYFDAASNTQQHEIHFVCAAVDRNLYEQAFDCPGEGLVEAVRSFDNDPVLQNLFPDLTIRNGLAISYTLWTTTTTPAATASACDTFGRCVAASSGPSTAQRAGDMVQAAGEGQTSTVSAAAVPGAPLAVIVAPTAGSFVAAGSDVSLTVAAEAGAALKEVTISLDGAVVQTLSFAQSEAVTRTLRTVDVAIANEGEHTLAVQASDWADATQTTPFAVTFTLDKAAPAVTIDASALTIVDTWQPESGILRFHGTVEDGVGLAAVQVREDDHAFVDATFGNGVWRTALYVQDPEGRPLNITVRAIDRAGRITEITQQISTELSAADAPDTTISSGPADPSAANTASFEFSGSTSAVVFDCQLDDGPYTPCASPQPYSDLSKGEHTFRVRAIDSRGFADLSPASHTWTINAGQPDATITGKPANPTIERTAIFTFTGDATSFECSLDGSVYAACTSPTTYDNLGNGEHTFLVRARDNANGTGAADRYVWTVLNAPPVADDQMVFTDENRAVDITLHAEDADALTYTVVDPPAHGVLLGSPPHLTYVPESDYYGADRFTFHSRDGLSESNLATVELTVRLARFALFAQEGVALGQNSKVMRGDVGVNTASAGPFLGTGVEASFAQNAKMQDPNSRVLADSLHVDRNAVVYNPGYNDLQGNGQVHGQHTTPLALPLKPGLPALPAITPGAEQVDVAHNGARTLAPGRYGALNARQNATVIFTGGVYHFQSWEVSQNAKFYFQAPSEVRIAGRLDARQNSYVGPAPDAPDLDATHIVIYVTGQNGEDGSLDANPKAAEFAQNAKVFAYLMAPNGTIQFRQNVDATGVFIAKWVLAEQNTKITRLNDPAVADTSSTGETAAEDETAPAPETNIDTALYLPLVTANAVGSAAPMTERTSLDAVTDGVTDTGEAQSLIPNDGTIVNPLYLPLLTADGQ